MALFYPVDPNKTLKQQYKEFAEAMEFKDLSKSEEVFVWGFACTGSPHSGIEDRYKRSETVIAMMKQMKAWNITPKESDETNYLNIKFSEKIKAAIDKMSKFKVTERMEARDALKNIEKNFVKIAGLDVEDIMWKTDENGVKYFDASGVNQFVTTLQKVAEELPKIVRSNEDGMGISASISLDLASGRSPHQVYMDREKAKIRN